MRVMPRVLLLCIFSNANDLDLKNRCNHSPVAHWLLESFLPNPPIPRPHWVGHIISRDRDGSLCHMGRESGHQGALAITQVTQ